MLFKYDTEFFSAVSFAARLIRDGTPGGLAVYLAANDYGVDSGDIARELGRRGGRAAARRRRFSYQPKRTTGVMQRAARRKQED